MGLYKQGLGFTRVDPMMYLPQDHPGTLLFSFHLHLMTHSCLKLSNPELLLWGYFYTHLISTVGNPEGKRLLFSNLCASQSGRSPCLDQKALDISSF